MVGVRRFALGVSFVRRAAMGAAFAVLTAPAFAGYENLFVFGDSLSDGGNASALTNQAFPPTPPYAGQFSNGPTAVQYLATNLGISGFSPSVLGGTNYAVGGATTGALNFNYQANSPAGLPSTLQFTGTQSQINTFLASGTKPAPDTSLYVVWAGPNDFFLGQATGENPATTVGTAVTNVANDVALLATQSGAQHILVPNMPNLGATPTANQGGAQTQAQLTALTVAYNTNLALALAQVEQQTGTDVVLFDTYAYLNGVLQDPGAYGFSNTTGQCVQSGAALQLNCAGYLFFDGVHPTTSAHGLLGDAFFQAIANTVPEPATILLVLIAFAVATHFARAARQPRTVRRRFRD